MRCAIVNVVVAHHDCSIGLKSRSLTARRPLWQGAKQIHCLIDEGSHVPMCANVRSEWGFESFSDVNHCETSDNRVGIISMDKLMKGVQIPLTISTCFTVLRHDGLGLDGNPDCRRWRLLNTFCCHGFDETAGGRTEDEVDVPFASRNDDLTLDIVDKPPSGGMLGEFCAHGQQI